MKIYFIILAFFILRMILAQKKKGKQAEIDASKLKLAELQKRSDRSKASPSLMSSSKPKVQTFAIPTMARQTMTRTTPDDIISNAAYAAETDNYDNSSYATKEDTNSEAAYGYTTRPEHQLSSTEHDPVSHFLKNTGLTDLDRRESNIEEEKNYSGKKPVRKAFVTKDNFKQFIIAKEIFDKPRGLRRR